jgi:hypothetical protein
LGVLVFDLLIDVGETSDGRIDEEVVHDVRIISLHWSTVWTDDDWIDSINFLEFIVIVTIVFLFLASCFFVITIDV